MYVPNRNFNLKTNACLFKYFDSMKNDRIIGIIVKVIYHSRQTYCLGVQINCNI